MRISKSIDHFRFDISGGYQFHFTVPDGDVPWYHEPVYNAYVQAFGERPGKTFSIYRYSAIKILEQDKDFQEQNTKFYSDHSWKYDHTATERTVDWYGTDATVKAFDSGPHSRKKLILFHNRLILPPGTIEDMKRVYGILKGVLENNPKDFPTPQSADAEVFQLLRKEKGPSLSFPQVRKIIGWIAKVEPEMYEELLNLSNPDARMEPEDSSGMDTSHARRPGPMGNIGGTQPARCRP